MNNGTKSYCPRCGAEMNAEQRYCIRCGYLNYENPENAGMKKYTEAAQREANTKAPTFAPTQGFAPVQNFGTAPTFVNTVSGYRLATSTGKRSSCLIFNIIIYIILAALGVFILPHVLGKYSPTGNVLNILMSAQYNIYILFLLVLFVNQVGMQFIFMKANEHWWAYWVPFYNIYIFFKIAVDKGGKAFLLLIPVFNIFYLIYAVGKLAKNFDQSAFLMIFFSPFLVPKIAFHEEILYKSIHYVENRNDLSKNSRSNNRIIFILKIIVLINLFFIAFTKKEFFIAKGNNIINKHYLQDVEQIVNNIEHSIVIDTYDCSNGKKYNEITNDVIYITFENAKEEFDNFGEYTINDTYEGYVKIDKRRSIYRYYIAVDNKVKGIDEISTFDIRNAYVKKNKLVDIPKDVITCKKVEIPNISSNNSNKTKTPPTTKELPSTDIK